MRPSLLDDAAWDVPATPDDVAEAVAFLLTAVEPSASGPRAAAVTGLVGARGFSRAELYHVCHELPWMPKGQHTFGRGLGLGDVQALVSEVRELRRALRSNALTDDEARRIAALDPSLAGAFGLAGTDASGAPRYVLDAAVRADRLGLPAAPRETMRLRPNPQDPTARVPLGLRVAPDRDELAPGATMPGTPPSATVHRLPPREDA